MDTYSKVISKSSVSWTDVQKNLKLAIQGRNFSVNKLLVKQSTDFLVKHIKNLNQNQVSEQLESLSQSGQLGFSKISKDNQNVLTAYLHSDDFYFEVPINSNGEIGDVKFAMFHEAPQSSALLKDIFCTWNWDLLIKNIEGIKSMYVLTESDRSIRENAYKALKTLENELMSVNQLNKKYYKTIDKIIKESHIGLFKKSEIGCPMRLYYYLSPQDLIIHDKHGQNLIESLDEEIVQKYQLGSYLTISLTKFKQSKLPDTSVLKQDQNLESKYYFDTNKQFKGHEVPAAFLMTLNQPVIMCMNTLEELESKIGIKICDLGEDLKFASYFELLSKTIHGKIQSDSFLVQLPDETQVYYLTETKEFPAVEVSKIPFTHPIHIQYVIEILRKQLLLNELASSCMRKTCHSSGFINARILELELISNFTISVLLQHPSLLCYTTIEIDVSNGFVQTKFRDHTNLHDANVINEVFHRCHSIPVTVRALLMKYKQVNLSLSDHSNENGNASIQQQVFGTKNHNIINSNLTFNQNSLFSQPSHVNSSDIKDRNNQNTFKENCNNKQNVFGNEFKIVRNDDSEDDSDDDGDEDDEDVVKMNRKKLLKNQNFQADLNSFNVKKRKATFDMNLPFAKKKLNSGEQTERSDELKQKNNLDSKSSKQMTTSDLKKSKSLNFSKVSNKPSSNTSPLNLQKQSNSSNQAVLLKINNDTANDTNTKDKIINKEKQNSLNRSISKDSNLKKETDPNNLLKKQDSNFSNVNMKIKSITKDGLKLRISKEPTKLTHFVQNSSSPVDNSKHQLNNVFNPNTSNTANNENSNVTTNASFSKHTSFNEILAEKVSELGLPKCEPKSKNLEKRSLSTQFKRSNSSTPTTPNYNDNNSAPNLVNILMKNKCVTPPACLVNILPAKPGNAIKSNFKIPKSKANQESTVVAETTTTTPNNTNSSIQPQQRNVQANPTLKKTETSSFSNTNDIQTFRSKYDDETNKINSNGIKDLINGVGVKTNPNTFSSRQLPNFTSKQQMNKDKNNSISKIRISPNDKSNSSPTSNNRPLTPMPTANTMQNFNQIYNRNSKTPLMNNEIHKNRNPMPPTLISSPINGTLTNNSTAITYNTNQILLTPTSPVNSNEDEIQATSKLTTIIPPDSPANNVCEPTTIPKLIPLERNNEITSNGLNENSDLLFSNKNTVEENNHDKTTPIIHYKCENSPEENSLIIDLVSTNNTLLTLK